MNNKGGDGDERGLTASLSARTKIRKCPISGPIRPVMNGRYRGTQSGIRRYLTRGWSALKQFFARKLRRLASEVVLSFDIQSTLTSIRRWTSGWSEL